MPKELSRKEHAVYKNDFGEFDMDNSGLLEKKEVLKLAAKQLGRAVSEEEGSMFLDQLDTNADGKVSLDEYIKYVVGGEYEIRTGPAQEVEFSGLEEVGEVDGDALNAAAAPPAQADITMVRQRLAMQESTIAAVEAKFKSHLDKDHDGGIDLPEFLQVMPELGQQSPALAKRLFAVFDHDNSGKISLEELLAGLSALCDGELATKAEFVFQLYDADKDGFLTKEELRTLLKSYFGGKAAISTQAVECFDLEDVDLDAEEPQQAEVDVVGQGKFDVIGNIEANVSEFVEEIFRGDANNDGKLSCEEFKEWLQRESSIAGREAVKWAELLGGSLTGMAR